MFRAALGLGAVVSNWPGIQVPGFGRGKDKCLASLFKTFSSFCTSTGRFEFFSLQVKSLESWIRFVLVWWVRIAYLVFVLTSASGGVDKQKMSSELLLQCFQRPHLPTKEYIDPPPLDFIKTYLGLKFPIHFFLNKSLSSAEVFYVLQV